MDRRTMLSATVRSLCCCHLSRCCSLSWESSNCDARFIRYIDILSLNDIFCTSKYSMLIVSGPISLSMQITNGTIRFSAPWDPNARHSRQRTSLMFPFGAENPNGTLNLMILANHYRQATPVWSQRRWDHRLLRPAITFSNYPTELVNRHPLQ
jgi:hypothetical protein